MGGPAGAALLLAREQLGLLQAGEVDAFLAGSEACFEACQAVMEDMAIPDRTEAELEELAAVTRAISEELAVRMEETSERTQQLARRRQAATAYMSHPAGDSFSTRDL